MHTVKIVGQSATKGDLPIKTDDDGNLIIQLEGATVNIGDVDIASPLGDQAKAASVSVTPATDIPATRQLGKVAIDQATPNANEVVVKTSALPSGAATEQGLDDILAKLTADPATQTTLAAILAKLIAAPSTEAKQDAIITALQTIDNFISGTKGLVTEDNSAAILAKLTKVEQLHANIDFSSASPYTAIAAPGAGYRIRIVQLLLMSGSPTPVNSEVAIKSGSTTIKTVKGVAIAIDSTEHCNLGINEALVLQATTADRIVGGVDYYLEAV